jgi:hypothetical protein
MTPKQQVMIDKMESERNMRSNIFKKAFERESRSNALKAKCLDCCCFMIPEITNCTVETCPLWSYRPYQRKGGE